MRLLLCVLFFPIVVFSQDIAYAFHNINPNLLKNANAVVRLDQMQVTVERQDLMTVTLKRVVTVLNEKGQAYVHAYAHYDKNEKIKLLQAKIFDKNGQEIKKFKEKDFQDQSAVPGGTLYSDSRVKFLNYTPVSYPYTVEFVRETSSVNTAFIPNWSFVDGYGVSHLKSSYQLQVPADIAVRYQLQNAADYNIKEELGQNSFLFVAENIAAIKSEMMAPAFSEIAPTIKLALQKFHLEGYNGTGADWESFGKWRYETMLKGRDQITAQTKAKMTTLLAGVTDPKEKVRLIYDYVQKNTRYISVQLGIGGWMPIAAEEVDRLKYGDCKGLTNYTKALLKSQGIPSNYCVVYAGSRKRDIDPVFASMQGNHIILNVPLADEEVWLECTSQTIPFGFLGDFTDDRNLLMLTPEGGKIRRTPKYLDDFNALQTTATCTLTADGGLQATVNLVATGMQYDERQSLAEAKENERVEHYKEYWGHINNLKVDAIQINNDKKQIQLKEQVTINANAYAAKANENLLFAPNMFNRNQWVPKRYRNRTQDFVVSRGYKDNDEFTIQLPQGYTLEAPFTPIEIANQFGHYKVSVKEVTAGKLLYTRELLLKAGRYDKTDYAAYRTFKKKIAQHDNTKMVLIKNQKP